MLRFWELLVNIVYRSSLFLDHRVNLHVHFYIFKIVYITFCDGINIVCLRKYQLRYLLRFLQKHMNRKVSSTFLIFNCSTAPPFTALMSFVKQTSVSKCEPIRVVTPGQTRTLQNLQVNKIKVMTLKFSGLLK